MNYPLPDEYIDIHTHNAGSQRGVFAVENLMAHEKKEPSTIAARAFSAGIHPWYLNDNNRDELLEYIIGLSVDPRIIAFGEAGFDKIRGPSMELQRAVFAEQVRIAGEHGKPLVIHCVKAWDELLSAHKTLKPVTPWLVHGFRGKKDLAMQLIARNMYLSFWFDFVLRPESSDLLKNLPADRIFLETDGADVDIRDIYTKVAADLEMSREILNEIIHSNFAVLFRKG